MNRAEVIDIENNIQDVVCCYLVNLGYFSIEIHRRFRDAVG
jgi:hypothetical protein